MTKKMILSQVQKNKALLIAFGIFLLAFIVMNSTSTKVKAKANPIYADTMIPKGFVLVPIELANVDTISALIDQFGVVDLYAGSPTKQGSRKIASRVKVLRAPLNPQQYAVLVPEYLSNQIMKEVGPFWAVVQNRQTSSDQKPEVYHRPVAIEYYKGG